MTISHETYILLTGLMKQLKAIGHQTRAISIISSILDGADVLPVAIENSKISLRINQIGDSVSFEIQEKEQKK